MNILNYKAYTKRDREIYQKLGYCINPLINFIKIAI